MLHSTFSEIDEMEMLKNKNHELEEQINKMKSDFVVLKSKIIITDGLIEQLHKKDQENKQLVTEKMKLFLALKSLQDDFVKLSSEYKELLLQCKPLEKANKELEVECKRLKFENESNEMIIKQLNASQSLNKDEILKLKAEIAILNKKAKCADKNATLVSLSSSKKSKSAEPEDELSDSDTSMVDVESSKFSNNRVSTMSKTSFSNDVQSKQCEEITPSGFKPSLSNTFSQGLVSQPTLNACVDGKDKGTSNKSSSLRNTKVKKQSQKNVSGKTKNSSIKKKKDDDELSKFAKSLEMMLCSNNEDTEASCDRTENKDISSRSPFSSPQKLVTSKTFNVTNNKNCDLRKNQASGSKDHLLKRSSKGLHLSSDDDEDDFEEVIDMSITGASNKMACSPQGKLNDGRKCESGQLHKLSHKYLKESVKDMHLSSDEEGIDDYFKDVIDMSITRTSAMATTGASEEDNLTAGMLNFNGGKNSATKSNQAVESTFKHSKEPVKELHLSSDEDDILEEVANKIARDLTGVTLVEEPSSLSPAKESSFKDAVDTNFFQEDNDKNVINESGSPTKTNGGSFVFEEQKDGGPKEGSVCMDSKVKSHVFDEMMKEMEMSSDEDDEQETIETKKFLVETEDEPFHVETEVQSLVKPNDSLPVIEDDQELDDELFVNDDPIDVPIKVPIDAPTEIKIERPSSQSTTQTIPPLKSEELCAASVTEENTECLINVEKLIDEPALTSHEEEELSKDILKETDDDTNVDILEDEFIVALNDDITVIAENEDTKGAEEISSPLHPITSTMDESFPDIANNIGAVFQSLSTVDAFNITDMESVRIMSDENAETLDVISNEATKTNGGSFVFEEQKDGGPKEGSVCMDSKVKIHVFDEMMKEMEMSSDEDDEQETIETKKFLVETEDEPFHVETEVQSLVKPNDSLPVIEDDQELDDELFVNDDPIDVPIKVPIDAPTEIKIERPSLSLKKFPSNNNHKVVRDNIVGNKDSEEESIVDMPSFDASIDSTEDKDGGFQRGKRESVNNHTVHNGAVNKKLKKNEYAKKLMEELFSSPHTTETAALDSPHNENISSQTTTTATARLFIQKALGSKFEGNKEKTLLSKVEEDKMKHVHDDLQISSDSSDDEKDDFCQREEMKQIKKCIEHKDTAKNKKAHWEDPQQKIQKESSSKIQKKAPSKLQNEAASKPTNKRKRCHSPELVTNSKKLKIDPNEMSLGSNKGKANLKKPNGNGSKRESQKADKVVNARDTKEDITFDDFQKLNPDDLSSMLELPRIHSPLTVPVEPVKVENNTQRRCFVTSMIKAAMSSKVNPRNGWITKWKKKESSLVNPWVPPFMLSIIEYIRVTAESHEEQEQQFIDCFLSESVCTIVKLKGNVKEQSVVSLCCVVVAMMRIQGNMERVRMLLYEVIRNSCESSRIGTVAMTICAVWPQCLMLSKVEKHRFSSVQQVLRYYVTTTFKCQDTETRFVKQLCGWEKVEQSPDEVVSKLFQQIEHFFSQDSIGQDVVSRTSWEMQTAVMLLCTKEGWSWTSAMVSKFLWPFLGAWGSGNSTSDHFVQLVIDLLGICLSQYLENIDPANYNNILNNLKLLVMQTSVSLKIRESALRSVLRLSSRSTPPLEVVQSIIGHKSGFSQDTMDLLKTYTL